MKKYLHIALMLLCVIVVSSCKDDNNDDQKAAELEAYKLEQDKLFQAKANDPAYEKWMSEAGDGYVFAKLIKKGEGKKAYYNSLVSVYCKGLLTDGTVFDSKLFEDGKPSTFAVSPYYATTVKDAETGVSTTWSSVISGWGVALQHMVEGDKYEVWIPQQLGYGSTAKEGSIPAYSTLIFEIELVSVDKQAAKANS